MRIIVLLLSVLVVAACQTPKKQQGITPPKVIKSPDLMQLSAKNCKSGETITISAILKLNKQGRVTSVSGLTLRDKKLAQQIIDQFKKAKYTPYLQNGVPIARNLPVTISLTCPK